MTKLVRLSPFRELDLLERRMRRVFDDSGGPVVPAADVYETPEEFVVELEVPGFAEQDLKLEVTDHTLVIRGEAEEQSEQEEKAYLLHERLERIFERRFLLPSQVDTARLAATFEKGVLEVHAPKLADPEPRKVAITRT